MLLSWVGWAIHHLGEGYEDVLENGVTYLSNLQNLQQVDKSLVADAPQHLKFSIHILASKFPDGDLANCDRNKLVQRGVKGYNAMYAWYDKFRVLTLIRGYSTYRIAMELLTSPGEFV